MLEASLHVYIICVLVGVLKHICILHQTQMTTCFALGEDE